MARANQGEVILLVEDEPMVRDMTRRTLERQGYAVRSADNGRDAIEKFGDCARDIHLMISDVIMPEMDGRELARQMKARCPCMRILFISGFTEHGLAQQGELDPDADFLAKPFQLGELARKVREILDRPPVGL
jgi:CheY-like chemotaxis protein